MFSGPNRVKSASTLGVERLLTPNERLPVESPGLQFARRALQPVDVVATERGADVDPVGGLVSLDSRDA